MGHHINSKGQFQSDLHPDLPPDKIIMSFKDPEARRALRFFAGITLDRELGADIRKRTWSIEKESA